MDVVTSRPIDVVRMPSRDGCEKYTEGLQQAGGVSWRARGWKSSIRLRPFGLRRDQRVSLTALAL